jgi:glycosyltransferase involved in cell wall biosynthesis
MNKNKNKIEANPLVSIGLPTYNRPELLARALDCLVNQTYRNLEIVISDNASPDPNVEVIAKTYCARDKRIRYIRNPENIGAVRNFWSVLRSSSGSYFMWAADDDEWEIDFIEYSLGHIGNAGTIMGDMETVFHVSGTKIPSFLPRLGLEYSTYENAAAFLSNMQPSIIYGLHRTDAIRACVPDKEFDFVDCLIIYRMLLRHGIQTYSGIRYRAGVHAAKYVIKYNDKSQKSLQYLPFLREAIKETLSSKNLGLIEKIRICALAVQIIFRLYRHLKGYYDE